MDDGGVLPEEPPVDDGGVLPEEPPVDDGGVLPEEPPVDDGGVLPEEPPVDDGGVLPEEPPVDDGGVLPEEPPVDDGGVLPTDGCGDDCGGDPEGEGPIFTTTGGNDDGLVPVADCGGCELQNDAGGAILPGGAHAPVAHSFAVQMCSDPALRHATICEDLARD